MSDRARDVQKATTPQGAQSGLADLATSADLREHGRGASLKEPSNASDLSTATISATNVHRVSPKIEPRRDPALLGTSRTHAQSRHIIRSGSQSKGQTNKAEFGIFSNPAYKYSGGLVSKILSFFANILKVLERLFIRLLAGPDRQAPPPQVRTGKPTSQPTQEHAPDTDKKKREERERAQTVRRD